MALHKLLLAAVAALSASCASAEPSWSAATPTYDSPVDVTVTPTAAVPESDRVSPSQLFAKVWDVRTSSSVAVSAFMLNLPGRVFFSHADGKLSSDVIMRIKVSGKSASLVENIQVNFTNGKPLTSDEVVRMQRPSIYPQSGPLLVEIELARRNSLRTLSSSGGGDVVVLENVLYSSDQDANFNASAFLAQDTTTTISASGGKIFVSDKSGSVTMPTLSVQAGDGNIQLELGSVTTSNMFSPSIGGAGNAVVFVDTLCSDVQLRVPTRRATGKVCIADGSNMSAANFTVDGATDQVSYPGQQTRPFTCAKLAIPERVPVNTESTDTTASAGTAAAGFGATAYAMTGIASLLLLSVSAF